MKTHEALADKISDKSIVLVGLMGAGKTCVGRCLSEATGLPFVDADQEIEEAAGCSIEDFFELYGEEEFRAGEIRVIRRLLGNGPQILATGGGAFMADDTQLSVHKNGISVWLKASLDILTKRTSRRGGRPLLKNGNASETLEKLINIRYPIYATANIIVETGQEGVEITTDKVLKGIEDYLISTKTKNGEV